MTSLNRSTNNTDCIFCNLSKEKEIVESNNLAVAFYDSFPVTKCHTLIIPKQHVADYFKLYPQEIEAMNILLHIHLIPRRKGDIH